MITPEAVVNQTVFRRCNNCGANLSLDDMRGQNCPYCRTVLAHHARAAEQAALVNQMLRQQGLAPQVPYQYGVDAPGVYAAPAPFAPPQNAGFPATPMDQLQQIAAEGQRRQAEFAAKAQAIADASAEDNVAMALGGHYGTALSRTVTVLVFGGLVVLAAGVVLGVTRMIPPELAAPLSVGGGVSAFVLLLLRGFWTPRASGGRLEAERSWQKGLPFALTGYFEALRGEPRSSCHLQVHLEWASPRTPSPSAVSSLVQRLDRAASSAPGDPFGWVSGDIPGGGGMARGNQRLVKYVHDLVQGALLPLHRVPLASVAVRRDW